MNAQTAARTAGLTATQRLAAAELLSIRPPVIDGTRVIPNTTAREHYYRRVTAVMQATRVADRDVDAFCDLCGVPE